MFLDKQEIFVLHDRAVAAGQPLHPLETILLMAMSAHHGQTRYNGDPYLIHPLDVSCNNPRSVVTRIARIGHDIVEDTRKKPPAGRWSFDDMRRVSIPEESVEGMIAMTKLPQEEGKYFDFMVRIGQTDWRASKMGDIEENMHNCPPERLTKYHLAYDYLEAIEIGKIAPGTAFGKWMAGLPEHRQRWDMFAKESTEALPAGVAGKLTRAFDQPKGDRAAQRMQAAREAPLPLAY